MVIKFPDGSLPPDVGRKEREGDSGGRGVPGCVTVTVLKQVLGRTVL